MPVAVADAVPVDVPVPEDVDVLVLVAEPVDVLVLVGVDVPVPVELAVAVLVDVLLALAVADAEFDLVPDVVMVADEVLVDVLVAEAVLVEVGVLVLVPVDVGEAVAVEVDVAEAVPVDVDVEVADDELDAIAAPSCPPQTCQRNVVAVNETEIRDSRSPASANVALGSRAVLKPAEAVTTMSPPSVSIRRTNRMPGFVGSASVRVSLAPTDTISQIWRSLLT